MCGVVGEDAGGYADMKRCVLSLDLNWDKEPVLRMRGGRAFQSRGAERPRAPLGGGDLDPLCGPVLAGHRHGGWSPTPGSTLLPSLCRSVR